MKLQLKRPIVFFDLETTGTSPVRDRIVQMYFIKRLPDGREEVLESLVNPGVPIPPEVSRIHGITDDMVKDEKSFADIAAHLHGWLSGCDLAGYNSDNFDIPLLIEEFRRAGCEFPEEGTRSIDVLEIERRVNSRRLSATYKRYTGKELEDAHDAGADIRATVEILECQLEKHPELKPDIEGLAGNFSPSVRLDAAGKLVKIHGEICFNFGKHKGEPVKSRPDYVKWMLQADFQEDTKTWLREAVPDK